MPLSMRKMCGFTSSCAYAMPNQVHCSALIQIHSIVSYDSVSGQRRPRSDCADAQADLGLRCSHVPEDMFSHDAAHKWSVKTAVNR